MALSSELLNQLVKVAKPVEQKPTEATVYGTIVEQNDDLYVQIDGSDVITPAKSTVRMKSGDRVIVRIKDHSAVVTGNLTNKSASSGEVDDLVNEITEVEILVADKVSVGELDAVYARIDEIDAGSITADEIEALYARIDEIDAGSITADELDAEVARIENLIATKLDAEIADITYATIADLEVTNATIYNLEATYGEFEELTTDKFVAIDASIDDLEANKLSVTDAEIKYANVDFSNITEAAMEKFYADSGLIENVKIGDATITGTLVGVTIKGDLIEGGTIVADKLVIQGEDGLYYKLNTDGMSVETEQTEYNSINGSVIMAQSITATKIDVDDLVAFDATIAGYSITNNTIYSGVKSSVDNTTRGVYLDNDGQVAFGDASNFLKFYKDADGAYKLDISASSLRFGASGKSIEEFVEDEVSGIEIGGRNLIPKSKTFDESVFYPDLQVSSTVVDEEHKGLSVRYCASTVSGAYFAGWANLFTTNYGDKYTISFWAKGSGTFYITVSGASGHVSVVKSETSQGTTGNNRATFTLSENWERYWATFTFGDTGDTTIQRGILIYQLAGMYMCGCKLETGSVATDWTPAPEDMATGEEVDNAQASADEANESIGTTTERVAIAESLIQQLSDSISMLVTDANGSSLMTQTENGWTFCMGETESAVNDMSQKLDQLQQETGDTKATVDTLNQAVNDIGSTMEYIRIGVYEDEPCIELGESDSDFSLLITNTRIMFRVGSGVPTKITTGGLVTQNIEVENALMQGSWVWKERKNGNYGLRWQGPWATITAHPEDRAGVVGDTAIFTIAAIGRGLTYKWQYRTPANVTNNVALWNNATGAGCNTPRYSVKMSTTSLSGRQYRCLVTDKYGKVAASNPALLTVAETT